MMTMMFFLCCVLVGAFGAAERMEAFLTGLRFKIVMLGDLVLVVLNVIIMCGGLSGVWGHS